MKSGSGTARSTSCATTPKSRKQSSRSIPTRLRVRSYARRLRVTPRSTAAVERPEEPHRDAVIDYHEPPDVDPPPLTYAQVFDDEGASIRAPRAVQPSSIAPRQPAKPTMLPWALLVLAIGCGVAAVAYLMSPAGRARRWHRHRHRHRRRHCRRHWQLAAATGAGTDTDTGRAADTGADTGAGTDTGADTEPLAPALPLALALPRTRPRIPTRSLPRPGHSIRTRRSWLSLAD